MGLLNAKNLENIIIAKQYITESLSSTYLLFWNLAKIS